MKQDPVFRAQVALPGSSLQVVLKSNALDYTRARSIGSSGLGSPSSGRIWLWPSRPTGVEGATASGRAESAPLNFTLPLSNRLLRMSYTPANRLLRMS